MPALVTGNNRIFALRQIVEAITEPAYSNIYLFIGKPTEWANDSIPPACYDSVYNHNYIWESMMSLKKLSASDMIQAIPRYQWSSNTVYDEYRHNYTSENPTHSGVSSLFDAKFYVVTDDYNVYKCIHNNYNQPSTEKPTGNSSTIFGTSDGYWWKYMYTISPGNRTKFSTPNFIPVEVNSTVVGDSIDGAIHHINVISGGSGYLTVPQVTITGDGTGATAVATVVNGVVTKITMVDEGTGYRHATVTVEGSAIAEAIISPTGGHGYDAYRELGAYTLLMNIRVEYDESGKAVVDTNYRTVGVLEDPISSVDGVTRISGLAANAMPGLELSSSTGDFISGELIYGQTSDAIGRVVSWDSITSTIRYIQTEEENYIPFAVGETIIGNTSGAGGVVGDNLDGDIVKYKGNILYFEQRSPIYRANDQVDSITFIIRF